MVFQIKYICIYEHTKGDPNGDDKKRRRIWPVYSIVVISIHDGLMGKLNNHSLLMMNKLILIYIDMYSIE